MDDLTILIPIGILLFLGATIFWMAFVQRRRAQAKRQQAARLGFSPVEKAQRDVLQRLSSLRPFSAREKASVRSLYTRRLPTGNLYLFDLETTTGNETTIAAENLVLVVSSTLFLPRFAIYPRMASGTGMLAALQDRLVQHMIGRTGLVVVPVSQLRRFSENYTLLAESQVAVGELIDSGLLDQLAAVSGQHIQAGGDAFAYSRMRPGRSENNPEEALVNLVDQAQRVLHVLEGYRGRRTYSNM